MCLILMTTLMMLANTSGQIGTECAQQFLCCINYLNDTSDLPSSCCDLLKNMIKFQPECLCSMISTKGSNQSERAGIDIADVGNKLILLAVFLVPPVQTLQGSRSKMAI